MNLSEGNWVYCVDVKKWYLYMGNANLRLPRKTKDEIFYWRMNHRKWNQ